MKILQWNVWYKECLNNLHGLMAEIKKFDADVVCLQEVAFKSLGKELFPLFELYPYYEFQVADVFPSYTQGNCILSRFPITDSSKIYIQNPGKYRLGYENQRRVYIDCELDLGSKKIKVGTVHSSYTDRFKETGLKDKEIAVLVERLSKHSENFIFTGDLNAHPNAKYIKTIDKMLVNCGPDYSENTWTTKPFSYNGFDEDQLNWRLDYVFATPDVKVLNSEIIKTSLSDHLPILVEVEM